MIVTIAVVVGILVAVGGLVGAGAVAWRATQERPALEMARDIPRDTNGL